MPSSMDSFVFDENFEALFAPREGIKIFLDAEVISLHQKIR
jgi:hypothetical protein